MMSIAFLTALSVAQLAPCEPPDSLILLDVSGTMNQTAGGQTKFTRAKNAIDAVLTEWQDDLAFGLSLFPKPFKSGTPNTGFCNMASEKAVGFALNNKTAIMGVLNTANLVTGSNDTPIYQALTQAGATTTFPNSDRKRAVILVTDGIQDCCRGPDYDNESDCVAGSTTIEPNEAAENRQDIIALTAQLRSQNIIVYAVGFGSNVDPLMLGGIAKAAGTERSPSCNPTQSNTSSSDLCYYNVQAGDTAALSQALSAIARDIKAEVCDGIDNDCNGQVDDGLTQACGGTTCGGEGLQICQNGAWGACSMQQEAEVCDGRDNDCDGLTDAIRCQTDCGPGTQRCVGLKFGTACVPDNVPEEVCNGRDDDCDGDVDEGCDCVQGELQPCSIEGTQCSGVRECKFGKWTDCEAENQSAEVCDKKDNDCNGAIDDETDGVPLCAEGSRCIWGECVADKQVQEVGIVPQEDLFVYRGQGVSRACNAGGSPEALLLALAAFALPALLRRKKR